jgi:UDP-2,3-diacylglucosamine hydrolase
MSSNKKIYFLSDFHLIGNGNTQSLAREKKIVTFLSEIQPTAEAIFIVGDLFDFWYEYKTVVPKGFVRILGKLAEITDAGIPVHFFVGNHDMWMKNYFEKELNIPIYFEPKEFTFNDKSFLIGHGDGLGPGDNGYKFLKKIFRNPVCQFLFGILPPTIGIGLANYFSNKSRAHTGGTDEKYLGDENEWLVQYCKKKLVVKHTDYFIFGHRHLPINLALSQNSTYLNLGDWIQYFTYVEFDGTNCTLKKYEANA